MSDVVKLYLIVETSLRISVDACFMILYFLRIYKLDRMASNNFHQKPKLMKFKIILIAILQFIFITHIALAYTNSSYYMYPYQEFSLISIAEIINGLLQIYIIRKEHKKKALKALKVPLLWAFWLMLDIANIIFVEIKIPNTTIILIIFEAMIFVALIVVGWVLEDKNDSREEFATNTNTPLLVPETRKTTRIYSDAQSQIHDSNKLYVEFNKQFNISMKNNQAFYEFKFAVFVGEESHILTKKQEDFISLVTEMVRSFPQCQELILDEKKHPSFSNMKKYGEEKQKVYETYLVKLTQNQKYYTTFLLDFLEVSQLNRAKLSKKRQKHIFVTKKDSFHNQDQERHNRKPFFNVQIVNNKIHISNEEILEIVLNKSKGDIQKFHNKLISERKLKMQLLNEQPDMNQLVHFIFRVVNSKMLWKSFSEWLVLGKNLQEKIFNMFDFWNFGFRNIKISVIGYEIAFDKQGSIHNLYLINLSQKKKSSAIIQQPSPVILMEDVTIKKRFNDFVKLDKHIKKFINTHNIKNQTIMSLPPKFSPFGTKTSPKSRQIYLDMYLNEVIKIENINHCVKFLQFLQIDLGKFKEQFNTIDEENLCSERMQRISSLVIDELQ